MLLITVRSSRDKVYRQVVVGISPLELQIPSLPYTSRKSLHKYFVGAAKRLVSSTIFRVTS